MHDSAERLCMPAFPEDKFVEAVKQVVKANAAWVPPYGSGATLYVRPFMIASGEVIGVKPATEYQFRILVTPVGPYFKGGDTSVAITVSDYDRAAPHGTGNIKAGLNYAMSLYPHEKAHAEGYAENLYLDPASRTYVEETGGANILLVDREGNLVVPQSHSDSILPSITRRSLVALGRDAMRATSSSPLRRTAAALCSRSSAPSSPAFRPATSRGPRVGSAWSASRTFFSARCGAVQIGRLLSLCNVYNYAQRVPSIM